MALNTANSAMSALSWLLSLGDDHDGAVPHMHRLRTFVKFLQEGGRIRIGTRSYRAMVVLTLDGVARQFLTCHSGFQAMFPFHGCGLLLVDIEELSTFWPTTHTAADQDAMHTQFYDSYHARFPNRDPAAATKSAWARKAEGIRGTNPANLDMRWCLCGTLHLGRIRTFTLLIVAVAWVWIRENKHSHLEEYWTADLGLKVNHPATPGTNACT